MKPVFYSEELKKYFDTEEACLKAEKEHNDKKAAEVKAAEEKKVAKKAVDEAFEKYIKLKNEYLKKYGEYDWFFSTWF